LSGQSFSPLVCSIGSLAEQLKMRISSLLCSISLLLPSQNHFLLPMLLSSSFANKPA
jgi:hypothetical protein